MDNYRLGEGNLVSSGEPTFNPDDQFFLIANGAISKGTFIQLEGSADGEVETAADNAAAPIGIAFSDYADNERVTADTRAYASVTAVGAVTRGAKLGVAAGGLVKTYASGASVGTALNTAADTEEVRFVVNIQV